MAGRAPIDWDEALRLRRKGWTFADIAREFGYAYKTVRTKLRAMGAPGRRAARRRQGRRGRRLVEIWRYMREKCSLRSHPAFERYGAKGVRVCRAWEESFDAFHDWAVAAGYQPGLRLARKARSRGYSPGNCRWVTVAEKVRRRQGGRPPTCTLTAFGETKGPAAWSRDPRCRVSLSTLLNRICRGDTAEQAMTAPPDPTRKPGAKSPPPRPRRKRIDWDEARRLYLEEGLSRPEIARRVGASYTGVLAAFERLGVRRDDAPAPTSTAEGRRLHKTWLSIRRSCSDPSHALYGYQGARGLAVCEEWAEFRPFLEWARGSGARRGLSLSRLDLQGDFSPENCAWMAPLEVARRRRAPAHQPPPRRPIAAFGEVKGLLAWARDRRCPVSSTTISMRMTRGDSAEQAISEPPQVPGSRDVAFTELTAFGITKGITAWTRDRRCKVSLSGIADRLRRGWSIEDAIATPPFRQPKEAR
jgi:hypothetical protein